MPLDLTIGRKEIAKTKILTILEELFTFEHATFDICLTYVGMLFTVTIVHITFYKVALITVEFFAARTSAMIMNRYAGREIDLMDDKKGRRASMAISKNGLLTLTLFFVSAGIFLVTASLLNTLALLLAIVALSWFTFDPHLKPRSPHRHFNIGIMQGFAHACWIHRCFWRDSTNSSSVPAFYRDSADRGRLRINIHSISDLID